MGRHDDFREVYQEVHDLLSAKMDAYGDSINNPVHIFSKLEGQAAIRARIDDKLSRIARGGSDQEDTLLDLIGYLIILRVEQKREATNQQPRESKESAKQTSFSF